MAFEIPLLEPFVAAGCWNVEPGSSKWIFLACLTFAMIYA
jgi:hypothetical protein